MNKSSVESTNSRMENSRLNGRGSADCTNYKYMYDSRQFDYQNPIKEKLIREINKRCEEKLKAAKTRNSHESKNHRKTVKLSHDYYVSAWDKLISKTKNNEELLVKGNFVRSNLRTREDSNTRRTLDPDYYYEEVHPSSRLKENEYFSQTQTIKNLESKNFQMFKPPLAPRGVLETSKNTSRTSQFKLSYTQDEIK